MSIGAAEAEGGLSIRSYSLTQASHAHHHPQIVVPLTGSMTIGFGAQTYRARSGHCVVIPAGLVHHYAASDEARFLVADMTDLPENATALPEPCVAISADLSAFCAYAGTQLTRAATPEIGALLYRLFQCLIARQAFAIRMDDRIMRAVMRMEEDLGEPHAIADLAATACLSPSQFKALFRKNLGMSCSDFLTKRRMEQARTLLMNTDYPVSVVAMAVGYEDASAFSRRFRAHFGQRPREVAGGQ